MSSFLVNQLADIEAAAAWLHSSLGGARVVAFYGEMGVGKTTLIKSLCKQLGAAETVTSPTFSLINEYELPNNRLVYHFDFYRIETIDEVYDFGYEEYFFGEEYCFIEWPELIEELLPEDCLRIHIRLLSDNKRLIELQQNAH